MPENNIDIFRRYYRAHERLKDLLGPLYEQEALSDAFAFNPHPEKLLDELEHVLRGKPEQEREEIRRRWLNDHLLDLR